MGGIAFCVKQHLGARWCVCSLAAGNGALGAGKTSFRLHHTSDTLLGLIDLVYCEVAYFV
jgi:hypothetical protein